MSAIPIAFSMLVLFFCVCNRFESEHSKAKLGAQLNAYRDYNKIRIGTTMFEAEQTIGYAGAIVTESGLPQRLDEFPDSDAILLNLAKANWRLIGPLSPEMEVSWREYRFNGGTILVAYCGAIVAGKRLIEY